MGQGQNSNSGHVNPSGQDSGRTGWRAWIGAKCVESLVTFICEQIWGIILTSVVGLIVYVIYGGKGQPEKKSP